MANKVQLSTLVFKSYKAVKKGLTGEAEKDYFLPYTENRSLKIKAL